MSQDFVTFPRIFYLRIFLLCLGLVVTALFLMLFAVSMEAHIHAEGQIVPESVVTLRASHSGLLRYSVSDVSQKMTINNVPGIQPGMCFSAGSTVAVIDPIENNAEPDETKTISLPDQYSCWMALKVHVAEGAAVEAGDAIMEVAPVDPESKRPLGFFVSLEIPEENCSELTTGLTVRVYSDMYHSRLHGYAECEVFRIDPMVQDNRDGKRVVLADAKVIESPFQLWPGGKVTAKIIVGRKPVYRIIMEH